MATKCGKFSIKSFYDGMVQRGSESFPTTLICFWARIKVSFFIWEATWKGILTMDILKRRRCTLVNMCFICKGKEESCNHILLHCCVCYNSWSSPCLEWFGCCIPQSKQHFLVGIATLLERGERRRGMLLLFACFGLFKKRGIEGF